MKFYKQFAKRPFKHCKPLAIIPNKEQYIKNTRKFEKNICQRISTKNLIPDFLCVFRKILKTKFAFFKSFFDAKNYIRVYFLLEVDLKECNKKCNSIKMASSAVLTLVKVCIHRQAITFGKRAVEISLL